MKCKNFATILISGGGGDGNGDGICDDINWISSIPQGSTRTFTVPGSSGSFSWSVSNSNARIISGQGTNTVRVRGDRRGTFTLTVTRRNSSGAITCTYSKNISVTCQSNINDNCIGIIIEGGGGMCTTAAASLNTDCICNETTATWSWAMGGYGGNLGSKPIGATVFADLPAGNFTGYNVVFTARIGSKTIRKSRRLECGLSGGGGGPTPIGARQEQQLTKSAIYPNPVLNGGLINLPEEYVKAEIYNLSGQLMETIVQYNQGASVNVLRTGIHMVKLYQKDGTVRLQRISFQ